MNCPNCNEILLMTVRSNVEIDYCPKCRGIWLDKGELDKLLEQDVKRSFDQDNEFRNQEHRSPDYSQQRNDPRYYKKKKSFLGDIFDF